MIDDPMDQPGDTYLVTPEMWAAVDPSLNPTFGPRVIDVLRPRVAESVDGITEVLGVTKGCVEMVVVVRVRTRATR